MCPCLGLGLFVPYPFDPVFIFVIIFIIINPFHATDLF